jgi:hypothetical protein
MTGFYRSPGIAASCPGFRFFHDAERSASAAAGGRRLDAVVRPFKTERSRAVLHRASSSRSMATASFLNTPMASDTTLLSM